MSIPGVVTEDPTNDTLGYLVDSNATWMAHEHNGRALLITSGKAKGYFYLIKDTDRANKRLICNELSEQFRHLGSNLYEDGIRAGDKYVILHYTRCMI